MTNEITTNCPHCDGYGENHECDKCLHCDGTGETTILRDEDAEIPFGPSEHAVECKVCGEDATCRHYERNEGGSLNAYWSIRCDLCGHSDTNDIFS